MILPQPLYASDKMLGRVIDSEITKCFFLQRGMEKVQLLPRPYSIQILFSRYRSIVSTPPPHTHTLKCWCASRYES